MKLFKSVILGSLIFSSACLAMEPAKLLKKAPIGGHDGSGADLWTSSSEQVHAAIDWALEGVKKDDATSWLFWAMPYGPRIQRNQAPVSVIHCLAMPILCQSPDDFLKNLEEGKPSYHSAWDYLKLSMPIELKEDGPCLADEKDHAAGSVSALHPGAHLCLSVYELSRSTPDGLRAEVASVLAHEMAHLMGFEEAIAKQVQGAIVDNFQAIIREDGSSVAHGLVSAMMTADSALRNAASFSTNEQKGIGAFLIGQATGHLSTVSSLLPDGINDNSIPVAKPELYEELKSEISVLTNDLTRLGWDSITLTDAQFDAKVAELITREDQIARKLEAFLGITVYRF